MQQLWRDFYFNTTSEELEALVFTANSYERDHGRPKRSSPLKSLGMLKNKLRKLDQKEEEKKN